MTDEQHTIAELQELAEYLRTKLSHAEKCCAEMREALLGALTCIEANYFRAGLANQIRHAISSDCGKDYVHKSEVERLREALRKIADTSQLTNVTFEVQAFTAVDIALTALKDELRKYGRHDNQCAARLGRNIACTCGLNAALKEGK